MRAIYNVNSFVFVLLFSCQLGAVSTIDPRPGDSLLKLLQSLGQVVGETFPGKQTVLPGPGPGGLITIDKSGSYIVSENIHDGRIVINANQVCLNLNGHEISCNSESGDIITINGDSVAIYNGFVRNRSKTYGTTRGIVIGAGSRIVHIKNVVVTGCNCGIVLAGQEGQEVVECEISACDLVANTTGLLLKNGEKNLIYNCRALHCVECGFELKYSGYNRVLRCQALDTKSNDFYQSSQAFVADGGVGNLFQECVAKKSQNNGGPETVATGFTLTGTEEGTKIVECLVNATTVVSDGQAYGMLLTYTAVELVAADPVIVQEAAEEIGGANGYSVDWTPDGQYLAVGYYDVDGNTTIQIYLYVIKTLRLVVQLVYEDKVNALAWRPGGTAGTGRYYGNYELAIALQKDKDNLQILYFYPSFSSEFPLFPSPIVATYGKSDSYSRYYANELSWKPDGTELAVVGPEALGGQKALLELLDPSLSLLWSLAPEESSLYTVAFSPTHIIYGGGYDDHSNAHRGHMICNGNGNSNGNGDAHLNHGGGHGRRGGPVLGYTPVDVPAHNDISDQISGVTVNTTVKSLDFSANFSHFAVGLHDSSPTGKTLVQAFDANRWRWVANVADQNASAYSVSWSAHTYLPYYLIIGGDAVSGSELRAVKFTGSEFAMPAFYTFAHGALVKEVKWSIQGHDIALVGRNSNGIGLRTCDFFIPLILRFLGGPKSCILEKNLLSSCGIGLWGSFNAFTTLGNLAIKNTALNNDTNYTNVPNTKVYDPFGPDMVGGMENIDVCEGGLITQTQQQ